MRAGAALGVGFDTVETLQGFRAFWVWGLGFRVWGWGLFGG